MFCSVVLCSGILCRATAFLFCSVVPYCAVVKSSCSVLLRAVLLDAALCGLMIVPDESTVFMRRLAGLMCGALLCVVLLCRVDDIYIVVLCCVILCVNVKSCGVVLFVCGPLLCGLL